MEYKNRKTNSLPKKIIAAAACILTVLTLYYHENKTLDISEYRMESEQIPEGFDGFRIVQISDLHNASFGKENKRLLERIDDCDPDIIVVTGDIVDGYFTDIPVTLSFVRQAYELAPVYYVNGNHENDLEPAEYTELMDGLAAAGAVVLKDECIPLECKGDSITLIGLQDENLQGGTLRTLTQQMDPDDFSLLLAHEPQYLDHYSECPVDLVLTGHAHGGLFRFPFINGVIAPQQGFFPKYTEGMHQNGNTAMIISRGIGNSSITFRIGNQPEIVCVSLQRPSAKKPSNLLQFSQNYSDRASFSLLCDHTSEHEKIIN